MSLKTQGIDIERRTSADVPVCVGLRHKEGIFCEPAAEIRSQRSCKNVRPSGGVTVISPRTSKLERRYVRTCVCPPLAIGPIRERIGLRLRVVEQRDSGT